MSNGSGKHKKKPTKKSTPRVRVSWGKPKPKPKPPKKKPTPRVRVSWGKPKPKPKPSSKPKKKPSSKHKTLNFGGLKLKRVSNGPKKKK